LVFGVPSLLFGLVLVIAENPGPRRNVQGLLLVFAGVWTGWFLASSLGRTRHFLPVAFIASIFFARFVAFLGDGLSPPSLPSFRKAPLRAARGALVGLSAVLLLLNPTKRLFAMLAFHMEDSPQRVVRYLEEQGVTPSTVASGERELDFLLGFATYDVIWPDRELPDGLGYAVCGPQARIHTDCPPAEWMPSSLVFSAGPYDVYRLESATE
jgi:hypothetical protein